MCAGANAVASAPKKGPTDRVRTCEEVGGRTIDWQQRASYSNFSIEAPGGSWCLSTDPRFNRTDRFAFVNTPLRKKIYPTGFAPQEEIVHSFWFLGKADKTDNAAELSTQEGLESFLRREVYRGAEVSLEKDDVVPGAICFWQKQSSEGKGDPRQPSWTIDWTSEGLVCQHPYVKDTIVGALFEERRRKGWNDPTPELTSRYRDEAIAAIRSLEFFDPNE